MQDSTESTNLQPDGAGLRHGWLLLIHQLPPKPDYLRVKVRRRLARVGAVPVRPSVYLLPAGEETAEDFAWLRRELVAEGGDAVVVAASFVSGLTDAEARGLFELDRNERYAAVAEEARAELERLASDASSARGGVDGVVVRLRRRLDDVVAMDFFDAAGRAAAEHAVQRVAHLAQEAEMVSGERTAEPVVRPGSTWVTRRGVRVDRMASSWLIRRFIDAAARFEFVNPESYRHETGQLRFDMYDGEFTHEGERCTFETLLARFHLDDAALRKVGELVHDVDCKDGKFGRPETAGLAALVQGIEARHAGDAERIAEGERIFDGLHAYFGRATG
jgi:hypothetical protein